MCKYYFFYATSHILFHLFMWRSILSLCIWLKQYIVPLVHVKMIPSLCIWLLQYIVPRVHVTSEDIAFPLYLIIALNCSACSCEGWHPSVFDYCNLLFHMFMRWSVPSQCIGLLQYVASHVHAMVSTFPIYLIMAIYCLECSCDGRYLPNVFDYCNILSHMLMRWPPPFHCIW